MGTQKLTSKQYFRSLTIVYFALIAGLVFFTVIAVFLNFQLSEFAKNNNENFKQTMLIVSLIFAFSGIAVSLLIFRKKLEKVWQKNTLSDKLNEYRGALIAKYAALEVASMFAIVAFMLCGDFILIVIAVVLILYMTIQRPSKERASIHLMLTYKDQQLINDDDAIVCETKYQGTHY